MPRIKYNNYKDHINCFGQACPFCGFSSIRKEAEFIDEYRWFNHHTLYEWNWVVKEVEEHTETKKNKFF